MAAQDGANHARRVRVRSRLEEPVHGLNKPFLRLARRTPSGPYIPIAW